MENKDNKHLDLLGLFHYIVGGMFALFSCMPFIHVFLGIAMLSGKMLDDSGKPPPPFAGWIFVIVGLFFVVIGFSMALCIIFAGRKLKQRKSRTFCMVVAGVECIFMPFGTVLGVFTLITLNKESIIQIFAES